MTRWMPTPAPSRRSCSTTSVSRPSPDSPSEERNPSHRSINRTRCGRRSATAARVRCSVMSVACSSPSSVARERSSASIRSSNRAARSGFAAADDRAAVRQAPQRTAERRCRSRGRRRGRRRPSCAGPARRRWCAAPGSGLSAAPRRCRGGRSCSGRSPRSRGPGRREGPPTPKGAGRPRPSVAQVAREERCPARAGSHGLGCAGRSSCTAARADRADEDLEVGDLLLDGSARPSRSRQPQGIGRHRCHERRPAGGRGDARAGDPRSGRSGTAAACCGRGARTRDRAPSARSARRRARR